MKNEAKKSSVKNLEAKKIIGKDLKTIKGGAKETFNRSKPQFK